MEKADADIKALEEKKKAEGITEAQKAELDQKITDRKADKEHIAKGIENARGLVASGSTSAVVNTTTSPTQHDEQHIQAVSAVVKEIVIKIIETDDLGQLCFAYLRSASQTTGSLRETCDQYLTNLNEEDKVRIQGAAVAIEKIKNSN